MNNESPIHSARTHSPKRSRSPSPVSSPKRRRSKHLHIICACGHLNMISEEICLSLNTEKKLCEYCNNDVFSK
jgi:hypothetical protein